MELYGALLQERQAVVNPFHGCAARDKTVFYQEVRSIVKEKGLWLDRSSMSLSSARLLHRCFGCRSRPTPPKHTSHGQGLRPLPVPPIRKLSLTLSGSGDPGTMINTGFPLEAGMTENDLYDNLTQKRDSGDCPRYLPSKIPLDLS